MPADHASRRALMALLATLLLMVACAGDGDADRRAADDVERCAALGHAAGTSEFAACRRRLSAARAGELERAADELNLRDFKHSWP